MGEKNSQKVHTHKKERRRKKYEVCVYASADVDDITFFSPSDRSFYKCSKTCLAKS